jgi:hypothetical protein
MNNIIRSAIADQPHGNLLVQFYRHKRSAHINIYMHLKVPVRIQISYDADSKEFSVTGFVSE